MQIAQPLLLLLAFGFTHAAFAGTGPTREKAFKKAFEDLANKKAAECLQPGQGHHEICTRPAIQMRMEKEKEKQAKFAAQVDPKARALRDISTREASTERAAGRAAVGHSVVVQHNRIDVRPSSQHSSGPRASQGPRSRM
jgi:flagellar biosynthesis/type III secretory pathway M-ring protein FliF/YscJ